MGTAGAKEKGEQGKSYRPGARGNPAPSWRTQAGWIKLPGPPHALRLHGKTYHRAMSVDDKTSVAQYIRLQ
eukprot:gene5350-9103_t